MSKEEALKIFQETLDKLKALQHAPICEIMLGRSVHCDCSRDRYIAIIKSIILSELGEQP